MSGPQSQQEPFIAVSNIVVFPHAVQRIKLTTDIEFSGRHVVLIYKTKQSHSSTGVLCEIIDDQLQSDGHFLVLEGMQRVNIESLDDLTVTFRRYEETLSLTNDVLHLSETIYDTFKQHHQLIHSDDVSMDTLISVIHPNQPNELADFIASYLPIGYEQKLAIIESINVYHRLELVHHALNKLFIDCNSLQVLPNNEKWVLEPCDPLLKTY